MCTYLDARDESLLEWIADSQISALVADNYAVEGMVGRRREEKHSLLPIHNLCLFRLGVPLGKLGKPEDLASAIVYLASEEAHHITGAILNVDGMAQLS